jgi:hypothetical protein
MSIIDKVIAAVTPPESEEMRLKARAKARADGLFRHRESLFVPHSPLASHLKWRTLGALRVERACKHRQNLTIPVWQR